MKQIESRISRSLVRLSLLLLTTLTAGISAQEEIEATLLAHWPLDGDGTDLVGAHNGVLATAAGATSPQAVPGKFGQALQFSGQSAVEIPINLEPPIYPVRTISFWVMPLGNVPARGNIALISIGGGSGPEIYLLDNQLDVRGGGAYGINPTHRLVPDAWNFIAVTWDYTTGGIYIRQDNIQARHDSEMNTNARQSMYVSPRDPAAAALGIQAQKQYLWIGAQDGIGLGDGATSMLIDDVRLYAGEPTTEQFADISGGITSGVIPDGVTLSTLSRLVPDYQYELDVSTADPGATSQQSASGDIPATPTAVGGVLFTNQTISAGSAVDQAIADRQIPELGYASEEEAAAAEARREREAFEAQMAEEQNALEAQRRAQEAATAAQQESTRVFNDPPVPSGQRSFSGIAGYRGLNETAVELPNFFIRTIHWDEFSDRPCFVQINANDEVMQSTNKEDYCGANRSPLFQTSNVSLNDGSAVIGLLEVCNNDNNNRRLKGIRIVGDRVNADGTTVYEPGSANSEVLANCSIWSPAVLCPINQYASGLIVHTNESSGDGDFQQIVGLQLICRAIYKG